MCRKCVNQSEHLFSKHMHKSTKIRTVETQLTNQYVKEHNAPASYGIHTFPILISHIKCANHFVIGNVRISVFNRK